MDDQILAKLSYGDAEEKRRAAQQVVQRRIGRAAPQLSIIACTIQDESAAHDNSDLPRPDFFNFQVNNLTLKDWQNNWALQSLVKLGDEGLPYLANAISTNHDKRLFLGLACVPDEKRIASSQLLKLIEQPNRDTREWALKTLINHKAILPESIHIIQKCLHDEDYIVRHGAIVLLRNLGSNATPLTPLLATLLDDSNEMVRFAAASLLVSLREHLDLVVAMLNPYIASHTEGHSAPHRFADAAGLLGDIGSDARSTVSGLKAGLTCKWEPCKILAAYALWSIEGDHSQGRELLLGAIGKPGASYTFLALAKLGLRARDAAHLLKREMQRGEAFTRVGAARSFWKVTNDVTEPIAILISVLDNPSATTPAALVLSEMGHQAQDAIPKLMSLKASANADDRIIDFALKRIMGSSGHQDL